MNYFVAEGKQNQKPMFMTRRDWVNEEVLEPVSNARVSAANLK